MTIPAENAEANVVAAGPAPPTTSQRSLDEVVADLNNHPFFMTTYDNTDRTSNISGEDEVSRDKADPLAQRTNPYLDALKELAYEGTPTEIAGNFKAQGNECAREKRWTDAREFYDKALTYITQRDKPKASSEQQEPEVNWLKSSSPEEEDGLQVVDITEEQQQIKAIEEACWVNRGLCSLELKNYRSAINDCANALRLNERNAKALYRTALANFHLDKLMPAALALQRLQKIDPYNAAAHVLVSKINRRADHLRALQQRRHGEAEKRRKEHETLAAAIKDRGVVIKSSEKGAPNDMEDARIGLTKPDDPQSVLHYPLLLVYPTASPPSTELIKKVDEDTSLGQHLEYVLPMPSDTSGIFGDGDGSKVNCYVESKEGGLMKVGKKVEVGKLLASGKVVVWDGLLKVFIVPIVHSDKWLADEKSRRKQ